MAGFEINSDSSPWVSARSFRGGALALFAGAVVLFIAARLWRLTASCLWFDEIFSVHAARHRWTEMMTFVAADIIHPPLFYVLLKLWIFIGGESLLWLRLLPALIAIATIVPFVFLCRELKLSAGETSAALLLIAVNGYLIKYAQEVRMYSLLLFLAACSLWLFFMLLRKQERVTKLLVLWCAVNLLLVYTHYAGWLLVLLQLAALCWRRRDLALRGIAGVAVLLIAYSPWIYLVSSSSPHGQGLKQNIGWVRRPGFADLIEYFAILNRPFLFSQSNVDDVYNRLSALIAFLVLGLPLVLFVVSVFRRTGESSRRKLDVLLLFTLGPAIVVLVASWLLPYSIWGTRHLIIAALPYTIVVVLAVRSLKRFWARATIGVVFACWIFLAGAVFVIRRPSNFIWCSWEKLAEQVVTGDSSATATIPVYAFEDLVAYHLWFASGRKSDQKFNVAVVKGMEGLSEDTAYFLPRQFTEVSVINELPLGQPTMWIAFRAERWDESSPPLNTLLSKYEVEHVESVTAQGQQAFIAKLRRR